MTKFGVCICNNIEAYTIKVSNLEVFDNYDDAYSYYLEKAYRDVNILNSNVWLVFIEDNRIVQFEQLTMRIKCKIVDIDEVEKD